MAEITAGNYRVTNQMAMLPGDVLHATPFVATPYGARIGLLFPDPIEPAERREIYEDLAEALNHAKLLRAERAQQQALERQKMDLWLSTLSPEQLEELRQAIRQRQTLQQPAPE